MILALSIDSVISGNIFFAEPKDNIVLPGKFTKMIFSNHVFTMNGIYVNIPICVSYTTETSPREIVFDVFKNSHFIEAIRDLETQLLTKYSSAKKITKAFNYGLHRIFSRGKLRVFWQNRDETGDPSYIIKISGVWETASAIGVTYKFIETRALA